MPRLLRWLASASSTHSLTRSSDSYSLCTAGRSFSLQAEHKTVRTACTSLARPASRAFPPRPSSRAHQWTALVEATHAGHPHPLGKSLRPMAQGLAIAKERLSIQWWPTPARSRRKVRQMPVQTSSANTL
eukprot:6187635-Pleurochrysis_carterae.AAC.2